MSKVKSSAGYSQGAHGVTEPLDRLLTTALGSGEQRGLLLYFAAGALPCTSLTQAPPRTRWLVVGLTCARHLFQPVFPPSNKAGGGSEAGLSQEPVSPFSSDVLAPTCPVLGSAIL